MGYGRSMLVGAVAGILVVALAVAGVVLVAPAMRSPMSVPGDRVLVVVAGRSGADGSQVAQLVAVTEFAGGRLSVGLVDPMTTVTVAGTTYDRLRDAYPFGGGTGVSRAYASATGGQPMPVITLSESAVQALVDGLDGVTVTVPADTSVFDGKRLFTFGGGKRRLSGAEVSALLSSAEYLKSPQEQATLRLAVATGLADGVVASSTDLRIEGVSSTLKAEDLQTVARRLREALPQVSITPLGR